MSKNIFSASNFFMHIFNMSVTYEGRSEIIETITILSKGLNVIQNNLRSHQVTHIWVLDWIISLLPLMVMIQ